MTQSLFAAPTDHHISTIPEVTALETEFPAGMLSTVATKESWRKEVHRPATSTHKWWAKRLGTVFRGICTAAISENQPEAESRYSQATSLEGMVVLDPFAGSGTTAVEAVKLGARAISFDINPVATLVQRQALQPWDWDTLVHSYQKVEAQCRAEIDRVHRTEDGRTVLYYFWVAVAHCPDCSEGVRLFNTPVYSRNAYPKRVPKAQIVCPLCLDVQEGRYDFTEAHCANGHVITPDGAVTGASMTCSNGHTSKVIKALGNSLPQYEMYAKMVVGARGQKTYEAITDWDRDLYAQCEDHLANLPEGAILPAGQLSAGENTAQAMRWNFREWRDFFNARQLYSLSLLATAIRDLPGTTPEREALAALFSGTLEFNNRFTSFKGEGTGAVRHMFSHHILKPERTPLEAHPWGTPYSSGSFSTLLKSRLQRADEYKKRPTDLVMEGGEAVRVDGLSKPLETRIVTDWHSLEHSAEAGAYVATRNSADTDLPNDSIDLVITDPPYMDNVHYAELADFFHAWLRPMQPFEGYAETDSTRAEGEVQSPDPAAFGRAIQAVWTECARVMKPQGVLAFTFHQARISGWVNVLQALRRAGLVVTAVQPVKGEMSTSVVKSGSREPSNLDSVVVCRKAPWPIPHTSLEDAYHAALTSLQHLQQEGVDVGAGDVRSVVRGTLLGYLSLTVDDLETRCLEVDEWADQAIQYLAPSL